MLDISSTPDANIIIPARRGSVGCPGKNTAKVGGFELVVRALDKAVLCSHPARVLLTTDDPDIVDLHTRLFRGLDVELHHRPAHLATSEASSEAVIYNLLLAHSLAHLAPVTALVQCTSPFTSIDTINRCINAAMEGYSAVSVVVDHRIRWPGETCWTVEETFHCRRHGPRQRRQDAPLRYVETGGCYAFPTKPFLGAGGASRFCGHGIKLITCDPIEAFEIDSRFDLAVCQALASHQAAMERAIRADKPTYETYP